MPALTNRPIAARQCRGSPRLIALALTAALATILAVLPAGAADYRLAAMDKLHIRVAEWRTAEGAVRDWSSLSGDYSVGPAGNISLPLIGELPVTGKTTAEIATAIGDQLQQKFGLLDRPDASVELAEFRPFFISGDVDKPGQYPYVPGLTVLKAVSLAGGVRRSEAGQRVARLAISQRDRIADARGLQLLDAGDDETYFAGRQLRARLRLGREHADLLAQIARPGRHQQDAILRLQRAVDHAHQHHHADVVVEP